MVLWARCGDQSDTDESQRDIRAIEFDRLEEMGFPLRLISDTGLVNRLKPWNERQCKCQLDSATRQQYNSHQRQVNELPYGFVIDMTSER